MDKQHNSKIESIGGSLGSLYCGNISASGGYDVYIYEITGKELQDRGAGIVLQQD